MSDLRTRILAAAAFEEGRTREDCRRRIEAFGSQAELLQMHVESARFEHAHNKELIEALADVASALEVAADRHYVCMCYGANEARYNTNPCIHCRNKAESSDALAKLEALLGDTP